jgi:hypothetical protein
MLASRFIPDADVTLVYIKCACGTDYKLPSYYVAATQLHSTVSAGPVPTVLKHEHVFRKSEHSREHVIAVG